jgi:TolB-like protein
VDQPIEQKLAAILAADVAGYSALMGDDERATVATLDAYRAVFRAHVGDENGRVVDTAGDSVLAVFPSTIGAVRAALAIQNDLAKRNEALPEHRRMHFRIGVNLGDVIEKTDGTVYGDGVNIAARLESLADPGGLTISGTTFDQIDGKLDIGFAFLGEKEVKNIAKPVRAYSAELDTTKATPQPPAKEAERPSIAVLAFENLSGDPDQEYFADGIAEDLITELSRLRWLQVTARISSFTYKGQAIDMRQVGRELGVRYVVEGSVRRGGERVRITAQLIDTATGNHLWAERYDRDLADIFALQDEITETLVAALQVEVGEFERERARRKPAESLDAWEAYQRGMWHLCQFDAENLPEARRLLRRAIDLDPGFVQPHAAMGFSHFIELTNFPSETPLIKLEEALRFASQAVALDDKDALAHFILGRIRTMRGDYNSAIAESRLAIDLNPSLAFGHYGLGVALWWTGRSEEAISALDTAIRLSPRDPFIWVSHNMRAVAHLSAGNFEAAVEDARQATRTKTSVYWPLSVLASALALIGEQEEAEITFKKLLELKPDYTLETALAGYAPLNPEALRPLLGTFIKGLRKAGMEDPEGAQTED